VVLFEMQSQQNQQNKVKKPKKQAEKKVFSDTTNEDDVQVEDNTKQEKAATSVQKKAVNGKKRKVEEIVQQPASEAPKKNQKL